MKYLKCLFIFLTATIESEEQQKLRWQVELEFVQCLANPNYLNCKLFNRSLIATCNFKLYFLLVLAQRGYFKDQAFINYLKYLQYWKEPEYAKYLMFPMCLFFLDLLQYEHFRREIVNSQCCKFIDDQAILHWQHYTRKRTKLFSLVNGNASINSENDNQATGGGNQNAAMQNGLINQQQQQPQLPQAQQQQINGVASGGIPGSAVQKMQ